MIFFAFKYNASPNLDPAFVKIFFYFVKTK